MIRDYVPEEYGERARALAYVRAGRIGKAKEAIRTFMQAHRRGELVTTTNHWTPGEQEIFARPACQERFDKLFSSHQAITKNPKPVQRPEAPKPGFKIWTRPLNQGPPKKTENQPSAQKRPSPETKRDRPVKRSKVNAGPAVNWQEIAQTLATVVIKGGSVPGSVLEKLVLGQSSEVSTPSVRTSTLIATKGAKPSANTIDLSRDEQLLNELTAPKEDQTEPSGAPSDKIATTSTALSNSSDQPKFDWSEELESVEQTNA